MSLKFDKQKGIGLLELMLAIAIIAILIIMATRYYQSSERASQVRTATQLINAVSSASAQHIGRYGLNFTGFDSDYVISTGVIPTAYIKKAQKGNSIVGPWPDSTLTTAPSGSGYMITIMGLPKYACKTLENQYTNTAETAKCTAKDGKQNKTNKLELTFKPGAAVSLNTGN